ncbi:MAG: DMT family protein [Bacteroidaceae bacterium]|nr:DMT family protein [Bacteroidaceae bacterium]
MKALFTILMLVVSNVLMTFAWYGNLKLQEMKISTDWPLYVIILLSWAVALLEYSFMIPANRMGSEINGGPFNLIQLKVIQEAVSLCVFTVVVTFLFKTQSFHWNHIVSFILLVLAVYFAFIKTGK